MKKEKSIKISIDIALTVLIFIMMAYQLIGNEMHEIMGMITFALFIIHNVLNRNWYKALFRGRYTLARIIRTIVNTFLIVSVLGIMISSFSISSFILPFGKLINIPYDREIHVFCAYWTFILIAIHIGLHWSIIIFNINKRKNEKEQMVWKKLFAKGIGGFVALYGVFAFGKREIGSYLLLNNSFGFWNYEEWPGWFFIDFFAVMGLCIFLTYYTIKYVQKLNGKK